MASLFVNVPISHGIKKESQYLKKNLKLEITSVNSDIYEDSNGWIFFPDFEKKSWQS